MELWIIKAIALSLFLSSGTALIPPDICVSLLPIQTSERAIDPVEQPPPYFLVTDLMINASSNQFMYESDEIYNITLLSTRGTTFRQFVVQARDPADQSLIGTFIVDDPEVQLVQCEANNTDSTVSYTNSTDKTSVSFQWMAPYGMSDLVDFRYSVAMNSSFFYVNLSAVEYPFSCNFTPTAIGEHPLTFRTPENCERSSCEYYVGMGPNADDPSYLDVYLEGNAAGWIAIGFSQNNLMENDDVLGCRVNSGIVTVVDTWNPSDRHEANVLDNTQNGLCVQSASFNNGRISCRFSRNISITDVGQDYNLDNSFRLLFGRRSADQGTAMNLAYHTQNGGMTPTVSQQEYNPVRASGNFIVGNDDGCPPTPTGEVTYTFTQGNPGDDYHFAARINPDNPLYLDMRLEGVASGWVGIGFSTNQIMENDDVLACQRNPADDSVAPVDTWNPNRQYTPNRIDPNQNGLCPYNMEFTNGRIICTFSRLIAAVDSFDMNLDDSLFQLYGMSANGGTGSLPQHSGIPDISAEAVRVTNATNVATENFPSRQLTQVHGILMLLAWPLLVVTAIFFAAWMKPALPNGEWFQVHRAFMIASLVLTALGFIFIFVANARNMAVSPGLISFACDSNTAHFVIGFIVFILQIINPIIALFRCKPTDSNRWIFNIFHGSLIGFIAELLALTNVGIGIALFESGGCSPLEASEYTILWVYIAFVAFLLIVQFALFIIFTVSAVMTSPEKRQGLAPSLIKYFFKSTTTWSPQGKDIEMTQVGKNEKSDDPPPRKPPSKDSPIRWGGFAVYIIGTLGLMMAIVIMIAVD